MDTKTKLSTLWIFAMLNYLYADVVSLMNPAILKQYLAGVVGSMAVTPDFLLAASVLMETAIAMVLLSRFLKYGFNRWANIVVALIHTLAVGASLFVGTPASYYIFFASIELVSTCLILWFAWRWKPQTSEVAGG